MRHRLNIIGGWLLAIALVVGWSYLREEPKHKFQEVAEEVGRQLPGARLIASVTVLHITSPISWFWPAATAMTYAFPDPLKHDRFWGVTMMYREKNLSTFMIDADCKARTGTWYDLDEPDSATPALNLWGKPVVAPNGKTYRRAQGHIAVPTRWIHDFCDTDWTKQREAVAKSAGP